MRAFHHRSPDERALGRYMVLRKATAATEAGARLSPEARARLSELIEETTRTGVRLAGERMKPSRRGRRLQNTKDGVASFDGPFIETKELLGGYVIVADSLDEATRVATRYIQPSGPSKLTFANSSEARAQRSIARVSAGSPSFFAG